MRRLIHIFSAFIVIFTLIPLQPSAEMTQEELYQKRMELYQFIEKVTHIPWNYIAAVDQYERNIRYVAESMPAFKINSYGSYRKRQGEYTIEDYYAMPEDRRVELIDGVIYDMASPSYEHQLISGELSYQLQDYVKKNKGKCRVFTAPFDVQLDRDSRTMVQPDLLVICDKEKTNRGGVYGSPDYVIEILSPSTAKLDVTIKLNKYMRAGVREYWIIDPENRQIFVYQKLADKIFLETYTFDDSVPVGIWEGRCKIDFPDISRQIDDWFGR